MIESQYTANVHKRIPSHIYKWKINDNYAGGVADAFYRNLHGGVPVWIEYKFIKALPKRETTMIKPELSSQQLVWLRQAVNSGEKAYVVIGCENFKLSRNPTGVLLSISEWESGITSESFKARALCYQELADNIVQLTQA